MWHYLETKAAIRYLLYLLDCGSSNVTKMYEDVKIKVKRCDFKGCEEIAFPPFIREWKGELLKLCYKHEAYLASRHYGRSLRLSELSEDDLRHLEEKEESQDENERPKTGGEKVT